MISNHTQPRERKTVVVSELEALFNEHEVARITGLSVGTIRRWRLFKRGPRYIKVSGSAVRYRPEDLKAYLDARPSGGGEREGKYR